MTHPLFVKGAAAKMPPNKRKMRSEAVFFDNAHPTWKHYQGNQTHIAVNGL
jgi:hypothetical protein